MLPDLRWIAEAFAIVETGKVLCIDRKFRYTAANMLHVGVLSYLPPSKAHPK